MITPVGAVAFIIFVSTSEMVSDIFIPMLAKYALRFSEIAAGLVYHVTCFSVELVNVNLL